MIENRATLYTSLRPKAHRRERKRVLLAIALPCVGSLGVIPYAALHGVTRLDVALFVVFYLLSAIGITVGYHRYFAHRSFALRPAGRYLLALLGYTAGQGPVVYWVANHRLHHAASDTADDPHSPVPVAGATGIHAFLHAHVGWIFGPRRPKPDVLAGDLLRDRGLLKLERYYATAYVAGLLAPGVVALAWTRQAGAAVGAIVVAGFFRQFLLLQVVYAINSVCHVVGDRPFATRDHSGNVWWLSIASLGESWHNNHHRSPSAANFGRRWQQVDLGFAVIESLRVLGIATSVRKAADGDRG